MHPSLNSSLRHDWTTPRDFFDRLDAEFGFTLDAAASSDNALCDRYYTEADDGLRREWSGVVWCNPPYGRTIGAWVAKGRRSAEAGATIVMLIPARTDTSYWHEHVMRAHEVRLVAGRLSFSGADNAPFPCAVVVFRGRPKRPAFSSLFAVEPSSPRLPFDLRQALES